MMKLNDRIILEVIGNDSKNFLQGLITNDINIINEEKKGLYTALLNANGRYLFDFFIFRKDSESYLIDIYFKDADNLKVFLEKYILLNDIKIQKVNNLSIFFTDKKNHQKDALFIQDPRSSHLGYRYISENNSFEDGTKLYQQKRFQYNIFEGSDEIIVNKGIIAEYHFKEHSSISYNKGCYLGQEFINACKNKLNIKYHIIAIKQKDIKNISLGEYVYNEEKKHIGKVLFKVNGYIIVRILNIYHHTMHINKKNDFIYIVSSCNT